MKTMKNLALFAAGVGATMAYQKYNKPIMKKVSKATDKAIKKANNKLEDMM